MSEKASLEIYNKLTKQWRNSVIGVIIAQIIGALLVYAYDYFFKIEVTGTGILPSSFDNLIGISLTIIALFIGLTPRFIIDFFNWCDRQNQEGITEIRKGFAKFVHIFYEVCFKFMIFELLFILLTFFERVSYNALILILNINIIAVVVYGFKVILNYVFVRYENL